MWKGFHGFLLVLLKNVRSSGARSPGLTEDPDAVGQGSEQGTGLTSSSLFLNPSLMPGYPRRGTENCIQEEAKEIG